MTTISPHGRLYVIFSGFAARTVSRTFCLPPAIDTWHLFRFLSFFSPTSLYSYFSCELYTGRWLGGAVMLCPSPCCGHLFEHRKHNDVSFCLFTTWSRPRWYENQEIWLRWLVDSERESMNRPTIYRSIILD